MLSDVERRIRTVEEQIRGLAREHAYIFDLHGSVVFSQEGSEDAVFIPDPIARGRLVLHNHPSGESLSRQDVQVLLKVQAAEFRVVTAWHRFRLRLPEGVQWRDIEALVNEVYFEELEDTNDRMRARTATAAEAAREVTHRLWVRIAGMFGWDYHREALNDEYADEHA